ncbi:MAG: Ribosomal RNA small subunit methyltransferase G [Syntrophorhabdus sp. PtaB.Bin047]|nr:MAG: Ribosomal RNA small subunit methyltransferase G [Syntrophorhabdus sp. PtaB.Bin047]
MDLKALIAEALEHFRISPGEAGLASLVRYVEELDRWGRRMNLVGLKDMERVCRELLADSFFLHAFVGDRRRLVDVGSGSGILAVPLAILNESLEVMSVDKSLRKVQFQRHVRRTLGLTNLRPVEGRIEAIDPLDADGLVAKAYGTTGAILAASDRHLAAGGLTFVLKGRGQRDEDFPGHRLENSLGYSLPGVVRAYRLLIYKRIC